MSEYNTYFEFNESCTYDEETGHTENIYEPTPGSELILMGGLCQNDKEQWDTIRQLGFTRVVLGIDEAKQALLLGIAPSSIMVNIGDGTSDLDLLEQNLRDLVTRAGDSKFFLFFLDPIGEHPCCL